MPPRPIINDALWRCLCPRYHQVPISSGALAAVRGTATRTTRRHGVSFSNSPFPRSRRSSSPQVPLVRLPTAELYEQLRSYAAAGRFEQVMNTIKILIKDRREKPNTQMYTALLHCYADSEEGTAGKLRKVLEEMETVGVELDSRAAERVLEALAVHPDYLLRIDVLEYMKERWFNLSDRAHNSVVAGMLRDRVFEQALEKLDDMANQGIRVEDWLWDKTLWMLLEFAEVEEAFHVLSLRHRVQGPGLKLSNALWLQLLDAAGKKHLLEAVTMIWNAQVVPGYIKPPTGTCLNVLSVASRSGVVKLATDVFRVLSERDITFTAHHYETLIECYLAANDLPAALSLIPIMQESGLRITSETLHPLFTYLSKLEPRPMEAFTFLQELESTGKQVPTAAVNSCLQASIALNRLAEAIEIYKALHTVSKSGPNTSTFNSLFRGCYRGGRKELAMFLANEMIQLDVEPDRLTYDRLMLVCMYAGDLNDALLYYEEMRSQGFIPRKGTHEELMRKTLGSGDVRCVAVFRDFKKRVDVGEARIAIFERMVSAKFEDKSAKKYIDGKEDATAELEGLARVQGADTMLIDRARLDASFDKPPRMDFGERLGEREHAP